MGKIYCTTNIGCVKIGKILLLAGVQTSVCKLECKSWFVKGEVILHNSLLRFNFIIRGQAQLTSKKASVAIRRQFFLGAFCGCKIDAFANLNTQQRLIQVGAIVELS